MTLIPVTDLGLGSFKGQPLVLVSLFGRRFHLRPHGRVRLGSSVTWTYDFARNGLDLEPCRVCAGQEP